MSSKPEPGAGPFRGALVPQEDGKVTLFADGKFVVPPGQNAIIQMTTTTGKPGGNANTSCPVVVMGGTHKEVFMVKQPRDSTGGKATGGQKPICDAAGAEIFAVTDYISGEKDDPSVYWEERGLAKSFTVSSTKRDRQTVRLTNMKGEDIELNG